MKFTFEAKSSTGQIRKGRVDAVDTKSAINILQNQGLIPISVAEEKEVSQILQDLQQAWSRPNLKELSVFYRQLATLIDAKVSLTGSLKAVSDQTENVYLRTILNEMVKDIEDGSPFSEAMAKYPDTFDTLSVSMVKAGELSGNLHRSVMFLAKNTESNYELNARVKSAMFYPGFILGAALIVGFIVFTFVLPKLMDVFKDMKVDIPWYTKMLMGIGDFMSNWWWIVLIAMVAIGSGIVYYLKTEDGKREWDLIKMKIPVFGKLFEYIYVARFADNLAVLLDGGIPIVRSLTIVSEVVNSSVYEAVILRAADEVRTGGTMSSVFSRSQYFPPIVSQMIKIGEDAGKVSEVLQNVSAFYSKETDRITRNLSSLIEPILIVTLGIGVGFLVFAILVPIYSMTSSMG